MKLKSKMISLLNSRAPTRDALEWWSHRQTKIYVLSYPKCGRTWLRLLIGKALDEHYHLGIANPMELGRMHALDPAIPRIRVTHERSYLADKQAAATGRFAGKTVIFLVRDPRDVLVSMYFQASRRRDLFQGDIGAFLRQPVGGLDTILDYYNVWAAGAATPRRFALVRYEDLHKDPATVLAGVLSTMELPVSPSAIDVAVGFSRFDNMRKLEATNAFKSERLRATNSGDAESFKTRKGKVGGYRDYLSGADLDHVNARIASRLAPVYADYRSPPAQQRA